jgi:ADP-ribosylglycohydrolase/fructose-1,6-bisphosphatase/inositol monophosphatase family enzyme
MSYERELRNAVDAALEAGELLRREFHRWGGPRGHSSHADADEEAEWIIRKHLMKAFPSYRYRGEETGSQHSEDDHVWLVDPNDGTSAFLRGGRGSAVSIALLHSGIPVVGVVYSFVAPDDHGDLIYWAEGFELSRNGKPIRPVWDVSDRKHSVILVSLHRENMIGEVLDCIQPYRYIAVPSIAYRLALAAAGDGAAAVSWHNPGDWDYGAGHALIRGAGGIFVNEAGEEIRYAPDGHSKTRRCFGGERSVVRDLIQRNWTRVQASHSSSARVQSKFSLARPRAGKAVASAALLSRAQGCLLGHCIGDAFGQQVEFLSPEQIRQQFPQGLDDIDDGGTWNTLAGQPTDDSELALLLARSIVQHGGYDPRSAAESYCYWFEETNPFDIGSTIGRAFRAAAFNRSERPDIAMMNAADPDSQANGSLMRISPLGIYGYRKLEDELWAMSEAESMLTHPHIICRQACALYVCAIADAIQFGHKAAEVYQRTVDLAERRKVEKPLMDALRQADIEPPRMGANHAWVLIAFQNAFYQLLNASSTGEAIANTAKMGGDSDTNAAIAGALLGAVLGRDSIPYRWRMLVLSCRPHEAVRPAHPRPICLWPVDLTILTENLLLIR